MPTALVGFASAIRDSMAIPLMDAHPVVRWAAFILFFWLQVDNLSLCLKIPARMFSARTMQSASMESVNALRALKAIPTPNVHKQVCDERNASSCFLFLFVCSSRSSASFKKILASKRSVVPTLNALTESAAVKRVLKEIQHSNASQEVRAKTYHLPLI